jgi:uncharacterized protein YcfJ
MDKSCQGDRRRRHRHGVIGAGAERLQDADEAVFADVVAVKEVLRRWSLRTSDAKTQVQHQAPVKDEHRVAGTVVGGVAGGPLGSGRRWQGQDHGDRRRRRRRLCRQQGAEEHAGKDVVTTTERRCKTVNEKSQKSVGYSVTYRLDGKGGPCRRRSPGPTLPVKDGQVVTTPVADSKS